MSAVANKATLFHAVDKLNTGELDYSPPFVLNMTKGFVGNMF
jgi:hypothetical protein